MTASPQPHSVSARATADRVSFEAFGGSAPENYEQYFVPAIGAPLAADLVAAANLRAGERVLDVACGTGIVARLAAAGVAPTGTVDALDLNPGMLAVARSRAAADGAIHWHEARAERMPFADGSYDVVFCQFGLQFFPDKHAALREIRRVLAPDARLILSVPGPTPAIFAILEDALREHATPDSANFVRAVFSLHETQALRDLLDAAGFHDVAVDRTTKRLRLPSPTEFLWQYVWSTPLASVLAQMDRERRGQLEHRVVDAWESFTEGDALQLDLQVSSVSAHSGS